MKTRLKLAVLALMLALAAGAKAQNIALKTNLLSDGFLNPSLGVEARLAPKWTLDVSGQINAWTLSHSRRWKHWLAQPEARYWLCEAFSGHFFGAHLIGGQYNIGALDMPFKFLGTDFGKLKHRRFQGWMAGAGVAYGYSWILDRHWNVEAEIGIGWVYTRYDSYPCQHCGDKLENNKPHNYVGPTKAAINLIYTF